MTGAIPVLGIEKIESAAEDLSAALFVCDGFVVTASFSDVSDAGAGRISA